MAKRSKGNVVALVDVEIMAYQVCSEAMVEERVGNDEYVWRVDLTEVRPALKRRIDDAVREVGASSVVLAVGSTGNWRTRVDTSYKMNRAGKKKPLGYWKVVDELKVKYDVRHVPTLEADDVLGLLATGEFLGRSVTVSSDKDAVSVPGRHYNPAKPELGVVEVSEQQADVEHGVLALAGDAADGYKGCQGVGDTSARRVLAEAKSPLAVWEVALALFQKAGHDREYALTQFRLARVLRHGEYDEKRKKAVLWEPPESKGTMKKRRSSWAG